LYYASAHAATFPATCKAIYHFSCSHGPLLNAVAREGNNLFSHTPDSMPYRRPRSDCKAEQDNYLLLQEHENLRAAVERIASFSPHVLLVERGVARLAQELLLAKGIVLVLNVKLRTLERLARCTGVQVEPLSSRSRPVTPNVSPGGGEHACNC